MECYKLNGKETDEDLLAIYLQILADYEDFKLTSVIEEDYGKRN